MNFSIVTLTNEDLTQYKVDMQEAFQKGFEDVFGKTEDIILPERDINHSLKAKGSVAYKAVVDGEMVGGAIVVIDEEAQHNHLDLFYVKYGIHSKLFIHQHDDKSRMSQTSGEQICFKVPVSDLVQSGFRLAYPPGS